MPETVYSARNLSPTGRRANTETDFRNQAALWDDFQRQQDRQFQTGRDADQWRQRMALEQLRQGGETSRSGTFGDRVAAQLSMRDTSLPYREFEEGSDLRQMQRQSQMDRMGFQNQLRGQAYQQFQGAGLSSLDPDMQRQLTLAALGDALGVGSSLVESDATKRAGDLDFTRQLIGRAIEGGDMDLARELSMGDPRLAGNEAALRALGPPADAGTAAMDVGLQQQLQAQNMPYADKVMQRTQSQLQSPGSMAMNLVTPLGPLLSVMDLLGGEVDQDRVGRAAQELQGIIAEAPPARARELLQLYASTGDEAQRAAAQMIMQRMER